MHRLAAYFKEREGFDAIVTNEGFAAYRISGDECYIRDIWTDSDYRKKRVAADLADRIAEIAKKAGCKYLSGSVSTAAQNSTASTKVLLAYGFEIHSAVPGGIYFRKDL